MSRIQTVLGTFLSPIAALTRAAEARYFALPLLIWTLASVGYTVVIAPRLDIDSATNAALDKATEPMSPHQREEAVAQGHKTALVGMYASAVLAPSGIALLIAFAFWLALKVAGGKPAFGATMGVVSHAELPLALKRLLSIPAILSRSRIAVADQLLPSNVAALASSHLHGTAASVASAIDLFTVWVLVLLVIGLATVAGVSRRRAALTTAVLWASYVAVFHVALKALIPGGGS